MDTELEFALVFSNILRSFSGVERIHIKITATEFEGLQPTLAFSNNTMLLDVVVDVSYV